MATIPGQQDDVLKPQPVSAVSRLDRTAWFAMARHRSVQALSCPSQAARRPNRAPSVSMAFLVASVRFICVFNVTISPIHLRCSACLSAFSGVQQMLCQRTCE